MDRAVAVAHLVGARRAGGLVPPLPLTARPQNLAEGYSLQSAFHQRLGEEGWDQRVGWKIGCTSKGMQAHLEIDHPCAGGLFAKRLYESSADLQCNWFHAAAIELEIGVRLGRDLPRRDLPRRDLPRRDGAYSRAEVAKAVDSFHGSIELVEQRYGDWKAFGTPALIADDFFSWGCVIGPAVSPSAMEDWAGEEAAVLVDGVLGRAGRGEDIYGHPLDALAWLAQACPLEQGLKAGEYITLGSVGRGVQITGPAQVKGYYGALGFVSLNFI